MTREVQKMSVYFSEKFKQLRKDNDLTQEQIADIFHVSSKCVSRWETGMNYPDVELLPHIAIFFKITLDELLGTEVILGEEKAKEYTRDIRNLLNSGRLHDAIELARKAVKEYPFNTGLHYHLVQALSKACTDEEPEKYKDEIIAVSERIINLTDYKSSLGHRYQLIEQYAKWGMKEEAKKLLETLPSEIWHTKEPWYGLVLEGKEWLKNQKLRIIRTVMLLDYFMSAYISNAGLDTLQKIEYRKTMLEIENMASLISDNDIDRVHRAFVNIGIAKSYCEINEIENALDYVEKATQDSMYHVEHMHKTNEDGSNYMAWSTPRNLPWVLWEDDMSEPQFDIIRNDERFIKCLELLKANSRELQSP
jgi:transcriptional regulator with XRE-family HTH domain